jgi:hypothetical protein
VEQAAGVRGDAKVFEVAKYVGITGDQATRFLGALEMCGYTLTAPPNAMSTAK